MSGPATYLKGAVSATREAERRNVPLAIWAADLSEVQILGRALDLALMDETYRAEVRAEFDAEIEDQRQRHWIETCNERVIAERWIGRAFKWSECVYAALMAWAWFSILRDALLPLVAS